MNMPIILKEQLKECKIKRLKKQLQGLNDGMEKANIEFEIRLLEKEG